MKKKKNNQQGECIVSSPPFFCRVTLNNCLHWKYSGVNFVLYKLVLRLLDSTLPTDRPCVSARDGGWIACWLSVHPYRYLMEHLAIWEQEDCVLKGCIWYVNRNTVFLSFSVPRFSAFILTFLSPGLLEALHNNYWGWLFFLKSEGTAGSSCAFTSSLTT